MPILIQSGRFGGFTPLSLSPWIWIDPSDAATVTLNGSTVSQINDKGTGGRNLTQGTGAAQPTYGTGGSGLNGLSTLNWDGGDTLLGASSTLAQPYTVSMVVQLGSTAGNQTFTFGSNGLWYSTGWGGFIGGASTGNPTTDTNIHQVTFVVNGAAGSAVRIDGVSSAISGWNTASFITAATWQLSRDAAPFSSGTRLGEFIINSSALSGANLTDQEAYLRAKWGTP